MYYGNKAIATIE